MLKEVKSNKQIVDGNMDQHKGTKSIKNGNSGEENPALFITDMLEQVPGVLQVGTLQHIRLPHLKSEQM